MVLDRHMTGQCRGIGHDDVVAEKAVVRNVRADHQEIVISDAGMSATAFSSAVNIDVFAKCVVGTDRQKGFFAAVLEILRLDTDHAEGKEAVVAADRRRALNDDVRVQHAAVANGTRSLRSGRRGRSDTLSQAWQADERRRTDES